jgi:sirohydrochlorin ferrochelatase
MKKLLLIVLVLGIAAAIAYVFGTESGRARRDELLARAGGGSSDGEVEIDLTKVSDAADDVVAAVSPTG